LKGVLPSRIAKIHRATSDALEMSVDEMEAENSMLKQRVKELECDLMSPPIVSSPITSIQPRKILDRTPKSSSTLNGTSNLLVVVRHCVGENSKKRMSLILEAWDLAISFVSLSSRITNLREYLQANLANEEGFYKDVLITFVLKISCMTELGRKEEDFPSPTHVKQLKACWIKKIKTLK